MTVDLAEGIIDDSRLVYSCLQMKPLILDNGGPVSGKKMSVKEGHVFQIASKFQQQAVHPDVISPTSKKQFRFSQDILTSPENSKMASLKTKQSQHARFTNARALFEKMGSAEELDVPSTTTTTAPLSTSSASRGRTSPSSRASSLGRPSNADLNQQNIGANNKSIMSSSTNGIENGSTSSSYKSSSAYFRSRSTSPLTSRSASFHNDRNGNENSNNSNNVDQRLTTSASHQNGLAETIGIVKSRRLSFQQKENSAKPMNCDSDSKLNISSGGVKELTNRQRNWFPSFEKGKQVVENVESSRRTSVKNDNTPNYLSGNIKTVAPSVTKTNIVKTEEVGNKNQGKTADSTSDSIDNYLKNWKKGGNSPSSQSPTSDGSGEGKRYILAEILCIVSFVV